MKKFLILALLVLVSGIFIFDGAFAQEACTPSDACNLSDYSVNNPDWNNPNFMPPAIAANGNDVTVVWQVNLGGNDPVYYKKSHDGGQTFEPIVHLGDYPTAGDLQSVWELFDNPTNNPEGLTLQGNTVSYVHTVSVGSDTYKVWHETITVNGDDNSEIFFEKNGGTSINISNNSEHSVAPQLAVDGNNVYIVWKDDSSGDSKAYAIRSTNGGTSFDDLLILDSDSSYSSGNRMNPSVAVANGNVFASWINNDIYFGKIDFSTASSVDNSPPVVTVPEYDLRLYGDSGSTQIVTFEVSATDNVGVVSGPTCTIESGSTITISSGSSTNVTCSATDAAGNTGYASFSIYTDDDFGFTLPSECPDDIRHVSGDNPTPMTVTSSGTQVTSSITMDWLGLGHITSKFVYQQNGETIRVVDVPAPTNDYPTFTDTTTLSPGEYTVFSCLWENYTGTISGGGGGTSSTRKSPNRPVRLTIGFPLGERRSICSGS